MVQAGRVLDDGAWGYTGALTVKVDAYLFVITLRIFLDAAAAVLGALPVDLQVDGEAAMTEFESAIGSSLVTLRNVLEHFADYNSGIGDLQKKAAKTGNEWARQPPQVWHETTGQGEHVVNIGVVSTVHTVDLAKARMAARQLDTALDVLVEREQKARIHRRHRVSQEHMDPNVTGGGGHPIG